MSLSIPFLSTVEKDAGGYAPRLNFIFFFFIHNFSEIKKSHPEFDSAESSSRNKYANEEESLIIS